MRLYPLLTIYLVKFNVYCVASLSANRHEDQDKNSSAFLSGRANESYIIMNEVENYSAGPAKDKTEIDDKREEERLFNYLNTLPAKWDPVKAFQRVDKNTEVVMNVEFLQWINGMREFLKNKSNFDDEAFIRSIEDILKSSKYKLSFYTWLLEIPQVKIQAAKKLIELTPHEDIEPIFKALAERNVRPDDLFRAMELRAMLGPGKPDRSFLFWCEYIHTYRSVDIKDDPAAGTFDDEELLNFLMNEMEMRLKEIKISLPVHKRSSTHQSIEPLTSPHDQVVALFESIRFYFPLKGIADSMLRFMVLKPPFTQLVLNLWSKSHYIPISIFRILRLEEDFSRPEYSFLFTLWLRHVYSYCMDLTSKGNYVLYAHLLAPTTMNPDVKNFFMSKMFMSMLEKIKSSKVIKYTGNLLEFVAVPRRVAIWLDLDMTPEKILQLYPDLRLGDFLIKDVGSALTLTEKHESLDVGFGDWLSFVTAYKQVHKEFTVNDVFLLLSPSMSAEEMQKLFLTARKVPSLEELANEMLKLIIHKINPTT